MMTTRPGMVNLLQGRHARRLIVLVALCASPHLNLDAQDGAGARAKRVLALHVVRRDSPGFDDTFRSILRDALADHLDYYSEYIDLNRLADDNYQSALRSYLRTRYVDDGLDLVIASGPAVVDEALLPPGSVIRYRESSFFDQYRSYVWGGAVIVIAQAALIGALLIQRRRRRRAEVALQQSETRHSAILRVLPDLMFVLDGHGRYVDFHARDQTLLFVAPEAFMGRTLREVMPPELGEMSMAAVERARTSEETVVIEYELSMDQVRHFEARLVRANEDCIISIVRDVTELRRAAELNRGLARRLIVSQEQERQRIARELHDDLSQRIALLNLEVDQIADAVPVHPHRTRLEKVSSQVSEIADDLSNLSHTLHPSRLQTLGLTESVRLLCREISHLRQVNVQFNSVGVPSHVDSAVALCLYRIAQEALHNIAKHSQAREASVHLTHERDQVHLQIEDSGVGFDPVLVHHGGLGLLSMRERVGILKGKLAINASPGHGTRIGVSIPVSSSSEAPSPFASV